MSVSRVSPSEPRYAPPLSEQLNSLGHAVNSTFAMFNMILACQYNFVKKSFASKGWVFPPSEILKNRQWTRWPEFFSIGWKGAPNHFVGGNVIQSIAFVINGRIINWLSDRGKKELSVPQRIGASVSTAFIASPVNNAFELTYVQSHLTGKNVVAVSKGIYENRGIIGFTQGWRSTFGRAAFYISGIFGIRDGFKVVAYKIVPDSVSHSKWFADIAASMASGAFVGAATGWIDLIKTVRQGDITGKKYKGIFDTGRKIYEKHGWAPFKNVTKVRTVLITQVIFVVSMSKDLTPYLLPNGLFLHEYRKGVI